MKVIHKPHSRYPYDVFLNNREWPPVTWEDNWVERPIHLWVKQNCGPHVFSTEGWIMLLRESDLIQLQLTWSQP